MKANLIIWISIVLMSLFSCSSKENTSSDLHQNESVEWSDLDSFHTIQSEAFYPYKDSANLEPAKRLAEAMAQQAEILARSIRDSVAQDDIHLHLSKLKVDTRALANLIKSKASDQDIGTALQALHNNFHATLLLINKKVQKPHH